MTHRRAYRELVGLTVCHLVKGCGRLSHGVVSVAVRIFNALKGECT